MSSTLDELYPFVPPPPQRQRRKIHGRPNYNQIHVHPLPILVNPLPPLIPHNPLSILQIAYTYISQWIDPPSLYPEPRVRGYYSRDTCSVHITDPSSVLVLWNLGFFGKGSLSRSEPSWLDREKKRLGLLAADTSEEHTAARREERKRFKNERARKERETIEEKLMEELLVDKIASNHPTVGSRPRLGNGARGGDVKAGKPTLRSKYEGLAEAALLSPTKGIGYFGGEKMLPTPPTTPIPDPFPGDSATQAPATAGVTGGDSLVGEAVEPSVPVMKKETAPEEISNQEHLQLTPEEAFFLSYALGVLEIYPEPPSFPPTPTTDRNPSPLKFPRMLSLLTNNTNLSTAPNDPFFLRYAVYHHFRSLGWVVRPGLKFGVDYLLYLRGPVFSHAEFAITILPAYTHLFWRTAEGRKLKSHQGHGAWSDEKGNEQSKRDDDETGMETGMDMGQRTWHWLHCIQRVQSQVRKTLIVAWVDVPPPPQHQQPPPLSKIERFEKNVDGDDFDDEDDDEEKVDINTLLRGYKVREMVVKRWIPNRSRD